MRISDWSSDVCSSDLLGEIEGRYVVLTHGLLILLVKVRIVVLYDFAQAELGQFLGNKLLIEQSALDGRLVLHETGDHLVQILATNARGFGRFGFGQPFDLDLKCAALLVESDIAFVRLIAAFAIIEAGSGLVGRVRSEEHTSELQSLMRISYAVFCLKKKI